jgi:preprotein translocase subunit SecG
METVIIVIHLMVIVALVAVVLMQRSEGGALGIGGGGNFMSSRGQGNVLTRATAILAVAFFATSIVLTVLTRFGDRPSSILDNVPAASAPVVPTEAGTSAAGGAATNAPGILDELQKLSPAPGTATTPAPTAAAEPTAPASPQIPTSE